MIVLFIFIFVALFFLTPSDALAWGPATHLKLGLSVIENLKILNGDVSNLISNNSVQFLYGCVSADIIQAKRFLQYIYNCHNWANGFKLLRSAKSAALKAFSLGYLGHLSADIVAHNCFIPAKIVETYSKRGLKHFLWEMRFDLSMYDGQTERVLKEIIKMDHNLEDELMNELLQTALFSFKTNKRIFSGLLFIQRVKRWQLSINQIYDSNNYLLDSNEVGYYFNLALDAMLGFLIDSKNSRYLRYDPTGKDSLDKAMDIMRNLKKRESDGFLFESDSREVQKSIKYFRNLFFKS